MCPDPSLDPFGAFVMRLVIEPTHATATGQFGVGTAELVTRLEGRKVWKHAQCLRLEATEHNLRTFRELYPEAEIYDQRPMAAVANGWQAGIGGGNLPSQPGSPAAGHPVEPGNPAGETPIPPTSGGQPLAWPDEMGEGELGRLTSAAAHRAKGEPAAALKAAAGSLFTTKAVATGLGAPIHPALWLGDQSLVEPRFKTQPYEDQLDAFTKLRRLRVAALFSEPGTGKTKIAIDLIADKFVNFGLRHLFLFSWPKGVHHQWVEEQIPEHMWSGIRINTYSWNGKKLPPWFGQEKRDELNIYSFNIEAINTTLVETAVRNFLKVKGKQSMLVLDESQTIKNPTSVRTKKAYKLGELAGHRMIMTGTPIARDLTDEWSQFKFLDERIIGIRYKVAFQTQYCRMGGFKDKKVIGYRNLDQFGRLVSPYIFRATKDQLNLPPKVYDKVVFELTQRQKDLQDSLKQTFTAQMSAGKITVDSAAALMLRLQQLACGYLVDDTGGVHELEENPRMIAVLNLVSGIEGKKIIWCRFQRDIVKLKQELGKVAVVHYGPSTAAEREKAKHEFINNPDIEYFIATPATAGTGVDGLQHVCSTAIYYSQSFNAIERWQSEERIHRIGTKKTAMYFDIIGRASIDVPIAANLRQKKSFSDFMLDDVRRMIDGI